jgi:hypothetical protein
MGMRDRDDGFGRRDLNLVGVFGVDSATGWTFIGLSIDYFMGGHPIVAFPSRGIGPLGDIFCRHLKMMDS